MRIRIFLFGLAVLILMAGCSSNSPKAAAQNFLKALEKNDMKALSEVATSETVQMIAMFGSKAQGMVAAYDSSKIKTITETISGNTADVKIIFQNGEELDFDLIKVDGKWKVTMDMGK